MKNKKHRLMGAVYCSVIALAVAGFGYAASAQPAPFECPWTAVSGTNPSSGGDYGGGPTPSPTPSPSPTP